MVHARGRGRGGDRRAGVAESALPESQRREEEELAAARKALLAAK